MSPLINAPELREKGREKTPPQIYVPELPDKPPRLDNGQEVLLDIGDVLPGDVLLSTSPIEGDPFGYISWLVRKLDQDWYSHAAFFDGETVIESGLSDGVQRKELKDVIERNRYTDVYRFASDACRTEGRESANCRTVDNDVFPIEPLKKVANDYVKTAYATHEAILTGLLVLRQRKLTTSKTGSMLLKGALNIAIAYCREMTKSRPDKAALTCSELVYRIFNEAEPAGRYRLIIGEKSDPDALFALRNFTVQVLEPSLQASVPTFDIPVEKILSTTSQQNSLAREQNPDMPDVYFELVSELQEFADVYEQLVPKEEISPDTAVGLTETARRIKLTHNANMISPSDLRNSGNLIEIGRVRKT